MTLLRDFPLSTMMGAAGIVVSLILAWPTINMWASSSHDIDDKNHDPHKTLVQLDSSIECDPEDIVLVEEIPSPYIPVEDLAKEEPV